MATQSYEVSHTNEESVKYELLFSSDGYVHIAVKSPCDVKRYYECRLSVVDDKANLKRLVFVCKDEQQDIVACLTVQESIGEHLFIITRCKEEEVIKESFTKTFKKLDGRRKGSFRAYADCFYWNQSMAKAA